MTSIAPAIEITGQTARIFFRAFDKEAYALFLRAKTLPEKAVAYDAETDCYTLTTHRRFAERLGLTGVAAEVSELPLAAHLFDYQQFIVRRALEAERFAVFADTGLGKTQMELELARQVRHITLGKVLILTMLPIVPQMQSEAAKFYPGMALPFLETRDRLIEWLNDGQPGYGVCNYEKMIPGNIMEFRNLSGLILDESSVLKTGGGKIKWALIHSAKGIPYKFPFSATPAPNDTMEYASQASFLEKIEGFWDYFVKRGEGKGDWELKPHSRGAFFEFMAAWSIYMRQPARFGFADNLANLPPPRFHDIEIPATDAQMSFALGARAEAKCGLFGTDNLGVTVRMKLSQAAKGFVYDKCAPNGVRPIESLKPRRVAEIASECVGQGRQVLAWTVFDEESNLLHGQFAGQDAQGVAVLTGKQKPEERLNIIERFRKGEIRCLISKAQLLGFGLNFQFCTAMIFSGWDDSYERFYQAVRRAYRYGQTQTVDIYMPVVSELEGPILENLMRKRATFEADAQGQEDAFREVYQHEHAREDYNRIQDPALEDASLLKTGCSPIGADEPVFLLRGQDKHIMAMLRHYIDLVTSDPDYDVWTVIGTQNQMFAIEKWQAEHGCKAPDVFKETADADE